MNAPKVPISWGELFDKITILQIKLDKLKVKKAKDNVKKELHQLQSILDQNFFDGVDSMQIMTDLKIINLKLWNIEDEIRNKERNKIFDEEFIELARSVYITNDDRSRVKRNINNTFGSELIEEKSYSKY